MNKFTRFFLTRGICILVLLSIGLPLVSGVSFALEGKAEAEVWFNKGIELGRVGRYEEALECFDKALKIDPQYAEAWHDKGWALGELGRYEEALGCFNKVLTIDPGYVKAWIAKSLALGELGRYEEALECFDKAVVLNPALKQEIPWTEIADSLTEEGNKLYSKGDYKIALERYNEALQIYEKSGNKNGEGIALNSIGVVYSELGDYQKALEHYQQSLKIARDIGNKCGERNALGNLGIVYKNLGDYQKALEHYQPALKIARDIGNKRSEGNVLGNIGAVYYSVGDYQKALEYYQQSLNVARDIGNKRSEGIILGNIGLVYDDLGDYQKALEHYQQSLKIARDIGDKGSEGNALGNIGIVYKNLGDYQKALEYHQQSLNIARDIGDKRGEETVLCNIGIVYKDLGDYQKALEHFQQSLNVARAIGYKSGEGADLCNIGNVYRKLGDYQRALEHYQQALKIDRDIGNKRDEGIALGNIGAVYYRLGDYQKALEHFQQSLKIARAIGYKSGEGADLCNIGNVYRKLGDYQRALEHYQQALKIDRDIGNRESEGIALANLGFCYEGMGELEKAVEAYREALAVKESIRAALKREEFRISYGGKQVDVYRALIRVLFKLRERAGALEEAFWVAERSKARAFLEALALVQVKRGVDVELQRQEREVLSELERFDKVRAHRMLTAQEKNQADKLQGQLARVIEEIRKKSPAYAQLKYPEPPKAQEIAERLPDRVALLEYVVDDDAIYIFLLRRGRKVHVARVSVSASDLEQMLEGYRRLLLLTNPRAEEKIKRAGDALGRVLWEPIIGELKGVRGVLIVPDRFLWRLPWSSLVVKGHYLVEEPYWLSVEASASVWQEILASPAPKTPSDSLIAFAPFAPDKKGKAIRRKAGYLDRYYADRGVNLNLLPGTRDEVKSVSRLFSRPTVYLPPDATRKRALEESGKNRYVLYSTHGYGDEQNPQLSYVAFRDKEGVVQYLTTAQALSELDLQGTQILVLSACQTGKGKVVRGEGLMGLTRSMFYAGTRQVVASHWDVHDEATKDLMVAFFRRLKRGKPAAQALKEAKLEVMKKRFDNGELLGRLPYFWSAFELYGLAD